jgi:tartronate-semialdehyde synthase
VNIVAKLAAPTTWWSASSGDYSFGFVMEEVAVAVQYRIPYVLVMLNNGSMSLIHQPEKYQYDMRLLRGHRPRNARTAPSAWTTSGSWRPWARSAAGSTRPTRHPPGHRVGHPGQRGARVPALVEIIVERETDVAMRKSLDNINEYAPIEEDEQEFAQFTDNIPERD